MRRLLCIAAISVAGLFACAAGAAAGPLVYFGGEVQNQPKVYLTFWGQNWNQHPVARQELLNLYSNISASGWHGLLTQYYDTSGPISHSLTVADHWTDESIAAPSGINDEQLEDEVEYAISQRGWPQGGSDVQYVIFPAPGSGYEPGYVKGCGQHRYSSRLNAVFIYVGWPGNEPFSTPPCREDPTGQNRAWVGASATASHEYAEAVVNPAGTRFGLQMGWTDAVAFQEEISNKCIGAPIGLVNGSWVVSIYSNVHGGCMLTYPGWNPTQAPPTSDTEAASNVSEFQATLNGTVNPNGSATTYRFEYGTTTSYGESVPVPGANAGSGTSAVPVSVTADRLEPGTTYHYRLVASNAGGTTYGADLTLRTSGWRFMRGLSNGSGISGWSTAIGMDLPLMAVGDLDGDEKDDVVSVERDNGLYRYKFGHSDGSSIASWSQVLTGMGRPTRLALGDLSGDGKADVLAVEPEGNGQYRYMLGTGTGAGISNWSQVMSGMGYPHKLALGDLTGDGKADIVAVESQPTGKYRYMLGTSNGAGIGSWSQVMSEMAYAEFMDLGDLTGDGKADILSVENQGNGKFRYMLGVSNGAGIGSWSQVMSEMSGPYFLNADDFNADGKADIVAVESEGAGKYRYMLGTSNGAGVGSWSQVLTGMGLPVRSDLGDLTGDGKADILSVETEATGSYNYRLGVSSGSGVSNWNQLVSWMRTPRATALGDVNSDGRADVVSVESEGNGKYRYKFGFSGAFGIVTNWKTVLTGMGLPNALGVGDLTGDGKADIVAVEPDGSGKYRYMLGKSSGTGISSWSSILSGMGLPTRMELGDFSGDGKADIIAFEPAGAGKYRIMRGLSSGTGISSWGQVLGGLSYPQKAAVADLTGDGKADVVAVESQGNGQYRYMLGKSSGSGISSWSQVLANMAYAEFMDLGDVTGDGKADIVSVENQGNGQFRFMLGASNGSGVGSWSQVMSGMAGPYFFHAGDLDADGKADIVSAETM